MCFPPFICLDQSKVEYTGKFLDNNTSLILWKSELHLLVKIIQARHADIYSLQVKMHRQCWWLYGKIVICNWKSNLFNGIIVLLVFALASIKINGKHYFCSRSCITGLFFSFCRQFCCFGFFLKISTGKRSNNLRNKK